MLGDPKSRMLATNPLPHPSGSSLSGGAKAGCESAGCSWEGSVFWAVLCAMNGTAALVGLLVSWCDQGEVTAAARRAKPELSRMIRAVWIWSQRWRRIRQCAGSPCCSSHRSTATLIGMLRTSVVASIAE